MHDSLDDKQTVRRALRLKRNDWVQTLSEQEIAISFSQMPQPMRALIQSGAVVAGYIPCGSEADPSKLLESAHALGCSIALPHVTSKLSPMRFLSWQPGGALFDGPFGLRQPDADAEIVKPDIILAPLVAFDRHLMRLGQGAGHYDRALSILDNAYIIGIAWSVQELDEVPSDPWDIPLHAVLTEKEWISR